MSNQEQKQLRAGTRIKCPSKECHKIGPLLEPVVLTGDIVLQCDACGQKLTVNERTVLPKLPVEIKNETQFSVYTLGSGTRNQKEIGLQSGGSAVEQKSLHQMTEELAGIVLAGMAKVKEMQAEVSKVSQAMVSQFEAEWTGHELFQHWDAGYIAEFVMNPFFRFPVESFDKSINPYCAYVIAPRFFSPRLGVPCPIDGSYGIEALTPYSRLSGFPVVDSLADRMGLPLNLELEVFGRKIIGHGLEGYWRDIPGLEEDDDHRPGMPSVRMQDSWDVRTWLARHGVQPWQSVSCADDASIAKGGVFGREPGTLSVALHYDAWLRFKHHSRLMLNWYDVSGARLTAAEIASMFFGPKLFIAYDERMIEEWKRCMFSHDLAGAMWHTWDKKSSRYLNPNFYEDAPLLIVDCTFGPDDEVLDALMLYTGKLILVMDDPLLDAYSDNLIAPKYHALVAHTMVDTPNIKQPRRGKGNLKSQTLADAIRSMQRKEGH